MTDPLTCAPTLETERLVLRGPLHSDLPEFTRFMTSAPSMQAQGETTSKEQAWFGFLIGIGHWQWHGFGFFTLISRGGHIQLGRVGLLTLWDALSGTVLDQEWRCREVID